MIRFKPSGDLQVDQEHDCQVIRVDTKMLADRRDQRNHHEDGAEDLHDHAGDQQEHVQHEQEHGLGGDEHLHHLEQLCGHLHLDQVRGEADGRRENGEDRADQRHRLANDPGQVLADAELTIDQHLHQ
jgi:hypothetical protein